MTPYCVQLLHLLRRIPSQTSVSLARRDRPQITPTMTEGKSRHSLQSLGPVHPPKVECQAIKPSIARHVNIRVADPRDHDTPAILHEPRSYNATEARGGAAVLVSGAGGGVSGPASRTNTKISTLVFSFQHSNAIQAYTRLWQTNWRFCSRSRVSGWTTANQRAQSTVQRTCAPRLTTWQTTTGHRDT